MKKIPDNAKKVFEGIIFDVYHWEQEMFDGSFSTFEAIKRKDSVTIIATYEGKIVLNEEEQPGKPSFITLPGGVCERDEDAATNAKRELLEETGLHSNEWSLWFISDPWKAAKIEWNNYVYIAKNCEKVSEPKLDAGEKIVSRYITFDEFLELRNNERGRNKDLIPVLEKAASSEEEKQKLKDLLGITT